jgi:S-adenosylmethionine:tRNA ribosyltransferase-isomerase
MLDDISRRGVFTAHATLHVGIGTFRPIVVDDLETHVMHVEQFEVSAELAAAIRAARKRQSPVVAVGTTVVRALESAADPNRPGCVVAQKGLTNLLIQPGYSFNVVDGLLTNFHMPRSTLLALVGAFTGLERTIAAYRIAVQRNYRFLSYGDAMWIPART